MSRLFELPTFPPPLVCVVDSSVLIKFKRLVDIDEQWDLLDKLMRLVNDGHLSFPKQVAKELAYGEYPDAPGAWIGSAKRKVRFREPSDTTLVTVLTAAAELVDIESTDEREAADPYVAAMALEIAQDNTGCRVVVATNDIVDRLPVKLSLGTACDRLKLDHWKAEEFVEWARGS